MEKKYVYFQPQYVKEFICDSSKCKNNCCERGWNIDVDAETYKKYLKLVPKITELFKYNVDKKKYLLIKHPCPFLTEKKLCHLQLKYGEDFLSLTCKNYPRVTTYFEKFFERSLTLTCPVAAEKILFQENPMSFELLEVSEKIHGGNRILINSVNLDKKILEHVLEIQIAMISILQERTLKIDQRLIVLGFFLDKLDEIFSAELFSEEALRKLIAAYESKIFFTKQVPLMLQSISFDTKKFIKIIHDLMNNFHGEVELSINIKEFVENYERFNAFKNFFLEKYSTFLENFLVNELFMNCYPWRFEGHIIKNYLLFVIKYKIFELILLSMALKNPIDKENLISLVDWFCLRFDHIEFYHRKIFDYLSDKDDILELMDSLLEGSD